MYIDNIINSGLFINSLNFGSLHCIVMGSYSVDWTVRSIRRFDRNLIEFGCLGAGKFSVCSLFNRHRDRVIL